MNSDNITENSTLPNINVQNDSTCNALVTLKKGTDVDSSVSINDEIMDKNSKSEQIPSHKNPAEIIDHTCDDNVIYLLNKK